MEHLALVFFQNGFFPGFGLWLFLSISAISLFVVFIPLVTWIDNRRKEREAYYKSETMRRIAESSSEGAKAALQIMQTANRQQRQAGREGVKVGGLINIGVGVGLMIFLHSLLGQGGPWLCGLIPGLIGVAMLVYVFFMASPIE